MNWFLKFINAYRTWHRNRRKRKAHQKVITS